MHGSSVVLHREQNPSPSELEGRRGQRSTVRVVTAPTRNPSHPSGFGQLCRDWVTVNSTLSPAGSSACPKPINMSPSSLPSDWPGRYRGAGKWPKLSVVRGKVFSLSLWNTTLGFVSHQIVSKRNIHLTIKINTAKQKDRKKSGKNVVNARSAVPDSWQPHGLWLTRLLCPWDSPGKNTGMGCHALLQGILPTQGLNPRLLFLLHWQADSYHWATQEDINQFNINHQDINQCELVLMLAMQLDFYYVNQQGTRAPVCCSWWSMLELQKCMLNKDKMWHSRKKKKK